MTGRRGVGPRPRGLPLRVHRRRTRTQSSRGRDSGRKSGRGRPGLRSIRPRGGVSGDQDLRYRGPTRGPGTMGEERGSGEGRSVLVEGSRVVSGERDLDG